MDMYTIEENINDLDSAMWVLNTFLSRHQYAVDRMGYAAMPEVDRAVGAVLGCEGIKDLAATAWRGIKAIFKKIFDFLASIGRAMGGLFKRNKAIRTDFIKDARDRLEETNKSIAESHRRCMQASNNIKKIVERNNDLDKLFGDGPLLSFDEFDKIMRSDKKDEDSLNRQIDEAIKDVEADISKMHEDLISRCDIPNPIDTIKGDGKVTEVYLQNLGDGLYPNLIFIVKRGDVVEDIACRRASDKERERYKSVMAKNMRSADSFADLEASLSDVSDAADEMDPNAAVKYVDIYKKALADLERRRESLVKRMDGDSPTAGGRAILRTIDRRIRFTATMLKSLSADQHAVAKQVQASNVIMLDAIKAIKKGK